jgi:murein DD-endopeptidase MepM/ murein hydrolase activator NlpD
MTGTMSFESRWVVAVLAVLAALAFVGFLCAGLVAQAQEIRELGAPELDLRELVPVAEGGAAPLGEVSFGGGGGRVRLPERRVAPVASGDARSFFLSPVRDWYRVTDEFGVPRGANSYHGGIDLGLADGAHVPVYAACRGTVTHATYSSGYGNYVVVNCGSGWSTLYAHFSQTRVAEGDLVGFDTVVGISGSTGYSTGEHLHFEVRYNGEPLDPAWYIEFASR